jgi:hypothetical protein
MAEIYTDCEVKCDEEKCDFFKALTDDQQVELNRAARRASQRGKEFPGSLNTLCGICIKGKIIDSGLEEKIKELLKSK